MQDKDDPTLKSVLAITNYFIINIKDDKILLHPYKPIEKTELIYEEYDGIVYHVTTKECWEEIQKKGLSPKGRGHHKVHIKDKEIEKEINDVLSSSYLPEHIYVMASKNFKAMRIEANMLSGTIMRQKSKFIDMRIYDEDAKERMKKSLDDLVMIKVNLKKSPIRYKIWEDPTCKGYHAYFLTEYIPPMIMAKIEDKEWKIRKS